MEAAAYPQRRAALMKQWQVREGIHLRSKTE